MVISIRHGLPVPVLLLFRIPLALRADFVGHEHSSGVSTCAGRFAWLHPACGSGAFLRHSLVFGPPVEACPVPVPGPAGSARMI